MNHCPKCNTNNASDANYCIKCGSIMTDNEEVNEMDGLRKALNEAEETIQLLKKAFPEIEEKNRNLEKEKKELLEKQQKLIWAKDARSQNLSIAKAEIESLNNRIRPLKKDRNNWIISFSIMLFLFVSVCIYLIFNHNSLSGKSKEITQLKQKIETLERTNKELAGEKEKIEKENATLAEEKTKLKNQINAAAEYYPVVIKSIKVGNMDKDGTMETDYGKTIYAANSMYLKPQIEYIGLKTGQTITLYMKLYVNGTLNKGEGSPSGYTLTKEIWVSSEGKTDLGGWGNKIKGNWEKGDYRYEVWYNGKLLQAVDFKLY